MSPAKRLYKKVARKPAKASKLNRLWRRIKFSPNWKLGLFWNGNTRAAIASLRRTKARSFFTMLGIVIGVSSVVTVISLGEGLKQQITGQINQLGSDVLTIRPGKVVDRDADGNVEKVNLLAFFNASTITDQDISAMDQIRSLKSLVPVSFVTSSAVGDSGRSDDLVVLGVRPAMADLLNLKMEHGAFFNENGQQNNAIVGSNIARDLFGTRNPGAHTVKIRGSSFLVRGVLAHSSGGLLSVAQTDFNSAILIPYGPAKKLTDGNTNIQQVLFKPKSGVSVTRATKEVRDTLKRQHHGQEDFTILTQAELLDISNQVLRRFTGYLSTIAAVSLLVAGIGIMNIMLVAVSERIREIGVRKAIGATNRQILNQFLTEGLVLSVGGGIVGIIVAYLTNVGLRLYTDVEPVITWPIVLLAVGVSISVGLVFSAAPALKAARKQPIDALRGE